MDKKEMYEKVLEQIKEETLTETVAFRLVEGVRPSIFESKIGGIPYIPRDMEIPNDSFGVQLRFLAQIDCENLSSLPDFPHKGLLQFFISEDDIMGLDEEDGFKVFYYEELDKSVTEAECKAKINPLDQPDERFTPVEGEYGVEFKPCKTPITSSDFRYEELVKSRIGDEIDEDLFYKVFYDYGSESDVNDGYREHRLGGYPFFTQFDPRNDENQHEILLFQLDSDFKGGDQRIMWGDCGIGNFFISTEDLKNRDFTKVLYNWDCG